jgi:hypothetical protein
MIVTCVRRGDGDASAAYLFRKSKIPRIGE